MPPAWGAATDVVPKFVAPSGPAAQWTGALRNAAFFAYADNYLIDVKFGIIMDVEALRATRQAEVGASRTMIDRTEATFGMKPDWLVADTRLRFGAQSSFPRRPEGIEPHVTIIDKSKREDGTFSREDFIYDDERRSRGDMISYFSRVAIAARVRSNRDAARNHQAGRSRDTFTRRRAKFPLQSLVYGLRAEAPRS